MNKILKQIFTLFLILLMASSCGPMIDKLSNVGSPPDLTNVSIPNTKEEYKPVKWPAKEPPRPPKQANSLWQPGARTFFRDQRARRVGDILKVNVQIKNNANLDNKTEQDRTSKENSGVTNILGLENKLKLLYPDSINPGSLIDLSGNRSITGSGKIERKEDIKTEVAAMVTQILPNGNLVISGSQEIRVNSEVRELYVSGIARPEDISADNSINTDQLAEARISYGGRGTISDQQQPRIGNQIIDIISPF